MGKQQRNKKTEESEELSAMADDLDKVTAIAVVAESEGGQLLVEGLITDIVSSVDTFSMKYTTLTHTEFIALSASIKTKLDLVRAITKAPKGKKALKEMLEEALQE